MDSGKAPKFEKKSTKSSKSVSLGKDSPNFEDFVYIIRGSDPLHGRWSKFWLVLNEEGFGLFATQKAERRVFGIEVDQIQTITDLKFSSGVSGSEYVILLELSYDRNFLFRIADRNRWRDILAQIPKFHLPRKETEDSMVKSLEVHNDHFLHDNVGSLPVCEEKEEVMTVLELISPGDSHCDPIPISFPEQIVIRQVSASTDHAIAVTIDGRSFVWGEQRDRNFPVLGLGHDERVNQTSPVQLKTPFVYPERVKTAVCGLTTSALISTRGQVAVWGRVVQTTKEKQYKKERSHESVLGGEGERESVVNVVSMVKVFSPQLFSPLAGKFVSSISSYAEVCFAVVRVPGLDDVTEVYSWGSNAFGMLGHRTAISQEVFPPFEIEALRNDTIVDLSVSDTHALCCNAKGEVYIWGKNKYSSPKGTIEGILGPTGCEKAEYIQVPTKLKTFGPESTEAFATKVQAGTCQNLVITQCKRVFTWGYSGSSNILGQPASVLQVAGLLRYLLEPMPIPSLCDVEDIDSNGVFNIAKTEGGAIYSWGRFQTTSLHGERALCYVSSSENTFIIASRTFERDKTLIIKGSSFAWLASSSEKVKISSSWHVYVSHIIAFIVRVWNKDPESFIIFDALGNACHPREPTNYLIQRMLLANVTPSFLVTDLVSVMNLYQPFVHLRDDSFIQWAYRDTLLKILFTFPPEVISRSLGVQNNTIPEPKAPNKIPTSSITCDDVFYLHYSDRFGLSGQETLQFLISSYHELEKLTLAEFSHDTLDLRIETWVPPSLDHSIAISIQSYLPKTRMMRILETLGNWLRIKPADFFGSSQLMEQLLQFLQGECESTNPDISSAALTVRRILFLKMSSFSRQVKIKGATHEVDSDISVLIRYPAKLIAELLTWIDANLIFFPITIHDIVNQRAPKAGARHAALASWVEKELLQCRKSSQRQKMIFAIIDIMFNLHQMRNFFSYTALYGALTQRPIRKLTDNVWEKGTKLSQTALSQWKFLTKPEVKEKLLSPVKFVLFFEELPEPKLPFLGFFWNKLIFLGEKYKMMEPPETLPQHPSSLKPILFERFQAETEVAMWLETSFQNAAKMYSAPSDPNLLHFLAHVKGFRSDPKKHRQVANSYGKLEGKVEDVDDSSSDQNVLLFENLHQQERETDVESVLLTGRASFAALSDRLRIEVWTEWLEQLQQQTTFSFNGSNLKESRFDDRSTLTASDLTMTEVSISSSPPSNPFSISHWLVVCLNEVKKPKLNWKENRFMIQRCKEMMQDMVRRRESLSNLSLLLLDSEALEVTATSLLQSLPQEQTLSIFESILSVMFPQKPLASLFISSIREIVNLEKAMKKRDTLPPEYQKASEEAIWRVVSILKTYQPALVDFATTQACLEIFVKSLEHTQVFLDSFNPSQTDGKGAEWDTFAVLDAFWILLNDSCYCSLSQIEPINPDIKELTELVRMIELERQKKVIEELRAHLNTGNQFISVLENQRERTTNRISELNKKIGFGEKEEEEETEEEGQEEGEEEGRGRRREEKIPPEPEELKIFFLEQTQKYMESLESGWIASQQKSMTAQLLSLLQDTIFPQIQKMQSTSQRLLSLTQSVYSRTEAMVHEAYKVLFERYLKDPALRQGKSYRSALERMDQLGMDVDQLKEKKQLRRTLTAPQSEEEKGFTKKATVNLPAVDGAPPRPQNFYLSLTSLPQSELPSFSSYVSRNHRIQNIAVTKEYIWFGSQNGSVGMASLKNLSAPPLFASDFWFPNGRGMIRSVVYSNECVWSAGDSGIQVWMSIPLMGTRAAEALTFADDVETKKRLTKHTVRLSLKGGNLYFGKSNSPIPINSIKEITMKDRGVTLKANDTHSFKAKTIDAAFEWTQKILQCQEFAQSDSLIWKITEGGFYDGSRYVPIMNLATVRNNVWSLDSGWVVTEWGVDKGTWPLDAHLIAIREYKIDLEIVPTLVPEPKGLICLQKGEVWVAIGDCYVIFDDVGGGRREVGGVMCRDPQKNLRRILTAHVYVEQQGGEREIWMADDSGNLCVWDVDRREIVIQYFWEDVEDAVGLRVKIRDDRFYWNWDYQPDAISSMCVFHDKVWCGTRSGFLFFLSIPTRQPLKGSLIPECHLGPVTDLEVAENRGAIWTSGMDCALHLWHPEQKF